ncbi:hypothetical protein BDR05DRAFT_1003399 [Suillus weaverae]|nr:hypothetical protein BDR05DRAFT_1003399 [Suillus weaverae]
MKMRRLVLTTIRLLCVKQKDGGQVSLKSEVRLGMGDKGKERDKPREKEKERDANKDCRNVIESAEPKGAREFVILTVIDIRCRDERYVYDVGGEDH